MTYQDNRTITIDGQQPRTVAQFARDLSKGYITAKKFKRVLCAAVRDVCTPQFMAPPHEIIIIANGASSQWRVRLVPTSGKWDKLVAEK